MLRKIPIFHVLVLIGGISPSIDSTFQLIIRLREISPSI